MRSSYLVTLALVALAASPTLSKPVSSSPLQLAAVTSCGKFGDALQQCNAQSTTPSTLIGCSCTSDVTDMRACANDQTLTAEQRQPAQLYMAACAVYSSGDVLGAANCLLSADANSSDCQSASTTSRSSTSNSVRSVTSTSTSASAPTTSPLTSTTIGSRPLLSTTSTSSSTPSATNGAHRIDTSYPALPLLFAAVGALFVA